MSPAPQRPARQHPITLDEGFTAHALPDVTPPVAGARPWTWLAESAMSAEERADYLGRFVRGHGTVDPPDLDLAMQPRSRREVITGHLRQHVFVDLPGDPAIGIRLSSRAGAGGGEAIVDGAESRFRSRTRWRSSARPSPWPRRATSLVASWARR